MKREHCVVMGVKTGLVRKDSLVIIVSSKLVL